MMIFFICDNSSRKTGARRRLGIIGTWDRQLPAPAPNCNIVRMMTSSPGILGALRPASPQPRPPVARLSTLPQGIDNLRAPPVCWIMRDAPPSPAAATPRARTAGTSVMCYGDVHWHDRAPHRCPAHADQWEWSCGFYPGTRPGQGHHGTAIGFDHTRADFEASWRQILPTLTEANFQEWGDQHDWTAKKYAMWARGELTPSQKPNSMMGCPLAVRGSTAMIQLVALSIAVTQLNLLPGDQTDALVHEDRT
jgi:hypothetical protein